MYFEQYLCQTCHTIFSGGQDRQELFLYLSKLAAQMVTSTPLENLSLHLYESQNKNFNFGATKTLILHARSIFFKGGLLTKIWSKKYFS
jgi:hypothetical protein